MRLKQKVEYIASKLEELYPNPEIPLDHENNFTFLIAVMLSAQSTDKKVNEITPKLFSKANTPEKMDRLEINEIRDYLNFDCRKDNKIRFNFQMTDVQASMGIVQLKKLNKFNIPSNAINIYGNHPAKSALLGSNRSCYLLCTTEKKFDYWNNFIKNNKVNIKIVLLETFELNNLSNSGNHQGVVVFSSKIIKKKLSEYLKKLSSKKTKILLALRPILHRQTIHMENVTL